MLRTSGPKTEGVTGGRKQLRNQIKGLRQVAKIANVNIAHKTFTGKSFFF